MNIKRFVSGMLPYFVKNWMKYRRLTLRNQTAWSDPAAQTILMMKFRGLRKRDEILTNINDAGFQVFSASDEDGILLYLFSLFGAKNRRFVDIGAAGIEGSNTANLVVNHGWHGIHIDGSESSLKFSRQFYRSRTRSRPFPPLTHQGFITSDNINDILENNGFVGELDLLSVDIDRIDYWVWKALDIVSPRVVVMEFQAAFGNLSRTIPHVSVFDRSAHAINNPPFEIVYGGASLAALVHLGEEKGYDFVGCDSLRVNAFFVRKDVNSGVLPIPDIDACLDHPRIKYLVDKYAVELEKYPYEEIG